MAVVVVPSKSRGPVPAERSVSSQRGTSARKAGGGIGEARDRRLPCAFAHQLRVPPARDPWLTFPGKAAHLFVTEVAHFPVSQNTRCRGVLVPPLRVGAQSPPKACAPRAHDGAPEGPRVAKSVLVRKRSGGSVVRFRRIEGACVTCDDTSGGTLPEARASFWAQCPGRVRGIRPLSKGGRRPSRRNRLQSRPPPRCRPESRPLSRGWQRSCSRWVFS